MDRKAQRIETIRTQLRNLIYEQHGEKVDPKDITNTHRSRAPFQFVFKSDDPKQPKVSIASISQPDFDAITKLIRAGRLRAVRIDESSDATELQKDGDLLQLSPTGTTGTTGICSMSSSLESNQQYAPDRWASSVSQILPPCSTMLAYGGTFKLSPTASVSTQPPGLSPRSIDNFVPVSSFSMSTPMALDSTPNSLGTACWSQIYQDIRGLRTGAVQWAEDLGDIQSKIEELSKLEKQVGEENYQITHSEIERLKSENTALKSKVESLEQENRSLINERDFLKRLLD